MGVRATSWWCYLRSNSRLKLAIDTRIKERNLNNVQLSELTSIPKDRLGRYLRGVSPNITQFQLITLARELNISINLQVTFE